jgi:hypothetical protein
MVSRPLKVFLMCAVVSFIFGLPGIRKAWAGHEWLGKVDGRLSWSKYLNDTDDFNWNAQLGADFEILKCEDYRLCLLVNMETVLAEGDDESDFPVSYVNYTVEFGFTMDTKFGDLTFLLPHHECRHDVDEYYNESTPKWNIWGLRWVSDQMSETLTPEDGLKWLGDFSEAVSFGKYTARTDNDYDWDGIIELNTDILSYKGAIGSLLVNIHGVTQKEDRPSGRSYFVDYTIEPAVKFRTSGGTFIIFYQFQHRHDVDKCNGRTEDWSILGFRYEW